MPRGKILIVDDDPDIPELLNVQLRRHDYDTAFASDAISAISTARSEHPDLIVLDLGLPAGEGVTVIERLRAIASLGWIPIIVVSAREPEESRERALQAGAKAFVEKPIDMPTFLATVDRELAAAGPE